jgi:exodeoxyribonuclease III
VVRGFDGPADDQGARLLAATCGGVRVHSVYVPNGREVATEHYEAKLAWYGELLAYLQRAYKPTDAVAVCGDFNVAPEDRDVWDPAAFVGETHVTAPERESLRALEEWGLVDAFRLCYAQDQLFTWWDYRAGNFHKHMGLRIDLVMLSRPLADHVAYALVDRNARKGKQPSDHAPVFVDIDL